MEGSPSRADTISDVPRSDDVDALQLAETDRIMSEEPAMTLEQLQFAARVALYKSEELAADVGRFYDQLKRSNRFTYRTRLARSTSIEAADQLADEDTAKLTATMDLSRGRGYLQHPGHAAWRDGRI